MKYTTGTIVALVGLSNALPRPQYSELPTFSLLPNAGTAPGAGSGAGSGSGSSDGGKKPQSPSLTGGSGFDLGGLFGGDGGKLPKLPLPTGGLGSGSGFDLGSLLGGGKLPALPSGLDLGSLLGANGGKLPGLPSPTGGAGLDLGSLLGGGKLPALPSGFDLGSLLNGAGGKLPGLPAPTGGAGFDLGSLLGGDKPLSGEGGSGFDLGSLLGGHKGAGSGLGPDRGGESVQPTSVVVVPTSLPTALPTALPTRAVAAPSPTSSIGGNASGAGTIGTDCKPQVAGRGSTENGVSDKNCCTDMTVIFARGTGEPGNVGIVSGPPMFKVLREKLGADRVTVQGVDYAASSAGNANLGADGGKKMADLVATALTQCPSTKVIVTGYSQGAMVVHNAFSNGLTASKVAGAVLFGDPLKRQTIGNLPKDKIKQFCGTSDQICGGGGDGGATGSHISYGASADAAATFAIQAAGLA